MSHCRIPQTAPRMRKQRARDKPANLCLTPKRAIAEYRKGVKERE